MTISVYFIQGRRGHICNNDALSVVRNERELLDIIPCADLPKGCDGAKIRAAFAGAVNDNPAAPVETIKRHARKELGLRFT